MQKPPTGTAETVNMVRVLSNVLQNAASNHKTEGFRAITEDSKLQLSSDALAVDLRLIEEALQKYSFSPTASPESRVVTRFAA